jgi:hypothetical protein
LISLGTPISIACSLQFSLTPSVAYAAGFFKLPAVRRTGALPRIRVRRRIHSGADGPRSVFMTTEENKTKVTILTGTYRVKGSIELLPGARVTDYLVESKDFIAVTEAEVWELGNRHVLSAPFINVSLEHIQIVIPEE